MRLRIEAGSKKRKEPRPAYAISTSPQRYWATDSTETDDITKARVFYKKEKIDAILGLMLRRYPQAKVIDVSVSTDHDGGLTINGYPKKPTVKKPRLKQLIWDKYGGRCAYCGALIPIKKTYMDQFYPSRGDSPDNLMPCCHGCYSHKMGKTPGQYQAWIENKCRGALRANPDYRMAITFRMVAEFPRITFYYMTPEGQAQLELSQKRKEAR